MDSQHNINYTLHDNEVQVICDIDIINLSGATLVEGTGATMSDDEDDVPLDYSLDQSSAVDPNDMMGFGSFIPTEAERSLMERVRHELKVELKQVIIILIEYITYFGVLTINLIF